MKLSLVVAFIIFVVSLIVSVVVGLQIIWQNENGPSPETIRFLATSIIIMLAALFYIPVGEAMNRVLSRDQRKSSSDRKP